MLLFTKQIILQFCCTNKRKNRKRKAFSIKKKRKENYLKAYT